MPIRMRLALVVGAASVALFIVGGFIGVWFLSRGLSENLDGHLARKVRFISSVLAADNQHGIAPTSLRSHPVSLQRLDKRRGAAALQVFGPHGVSVDFGATVEHLIPRTKVIAALHHSRYLNLAIGSPPDPIRVLVSQIAGMPGWDIAIGLSSASNQEAVREVELDIVIAGGVAILIATAGAWFLAGAALAPVERLRRRAADISEHDLTARLDVPDTSDELAALARTMDDLLARHQRTLARQRSFIADAGHELRTPLAVLSGELELAGRPGRSPDQLAQAVRRAKAETDRVSHLALDLLLLATADEGRLALAVNPFVTSEVLDAAVSIRESRALERGVRLTIEIGRGTETILGDALRLRQAIDNLLDNALRMAPPGSIVEIRTVSTGVADEVMLEVRDEGPGFALGFIPHAFDRFARPAGSRDRSTGGAGLGLAVVRSIAEAHGGRVEAANGRAGGARVRIFLPQPADRPGGSVGTEGKE
ncbi:MAG: sensor histidine kinase [Acidimicrobiales bacterium]